MDTIVFLILRRMRQPLITLLLVYAISVLGLVLIPGQDDSGNVWHMDFFHAFYFVSYMSTTIGFGEIPYAFNDAQRLWVTLTMYAGVISWLYAIGTILTLVQDKSFKRALSEKKLTKQINSLREPFYLICGYGETGSALVKGLTDAGQHVVVIEINESRCNLIQLENLRDYVPTLQGDAQKTLHLQEAGLQNPLCNAVVAVTNFNEVNLKIALTSKLLHPHIKVICRADSHEIEKNMASFGTDFIIDPFDTFSTNLVIAIQMPCLYLLQTWLFSNNKDKELNDPIYPPIKGHWIVCGYGRFGKAVYKRLKKEGVEVKVIEATPSVTGEPIEGVIEGRGTEADTLMEADILQASGLIAGTNDDTNNLSIAITAHDLNPDLFTVVRQNHHDNSAIIDALDADMVMHPSRIIADKIRVLLGTPLLYEFVSLAYHQENAWACELVSRISAIVGQQVPQLEEIDINEGDAPAVVAALNRGMSVKLGDLMRDPWHREETLKCIVLMIERSNDRILLPPPETRIKKDDQLLFCSSSHGFNRLHWSLHHVNNLNYVLTGQISTQGWLWRKISPK